MHGITRMVAATTVVIKAYKKMIAKTTSDLEKHLYEIDNRLQVLEISDEDATKRQRIQERKIRPKQCLSIHPPASEHVDQRARMSSEKGATGSADRIRTNIFEDVSAGQDAHQAIVATLGDLISAKRVTTGIK